IQLWDVATGKRNHARSGHAYSVSVVAVSPDGKLVASGGFRNATLRLWDAATGKPLHEMRTADDSVSTCAFSADGKGVLSGGQNGTIQLWDTATGKELHRFVFENPANVRGTGRMEVKQIHLSPDGQRLAAFCINNIMIPGKAATGTLRVWD